MKLEIAQKIVTAALAAARTRNFKPLAVAVLAFANHTGALTPGLLNVLLNGAHFASVDHGNNQLARREQFGRRFSRCELFEGFAQKRAKNGELPDHLGDRITTHSAHMTMRRPLLVDGFPGDLLSLQCSDDAVEQGGQVIFQFFVGKSYALLGKI